MNALAPSLDSRLAELMMSSLVSCDLGDGIEVVHDVENLEIEMDCDLDDSSAEHGRDDTERMLKLWFEMSDEELASTTTFERADDIGTHQFTRDSAPYERIELELDRAFIRATIEDARRYGT